MINMLVVSNKKYVAFFDINQMDDAIKARELDPRLKNARIKEALQARPSEIEIGAVYSRSYHVLGCSKDTMTMEDN